MIPTWVAWKTISLLCRWSSTRVVNFFLNNIITSVCFTLNLDSHLVQAQDGSPKYFEPDDRISLFAENRMGAIEGVTVFLLISD